MFNLIALISLWIITFIAFVGICFIIAGPIGAIVAIALAFSSIFTS